MERERETLGPLHVHALMAIVTLTWERPDEKRVFVGPMRIPSMIVLKWAPCT